MQYTTHFYKSDITKYFNCIQNGSTQSFITNYLGTHSSDNVRSESDFYCLMLSCAINLNDTKTISHILEQNRGNIFTNVDSLDRSPLLLILRAQDNALLNLVINYLHTNITPPTEVSSQDEVENIVKSLKLYSSVQFLPENSLEVISSLYTDTSYSQIHAAVERAGILDTDYYY